MNKQTLFVFTPLSREEFQETKVHIVPISRVDTHPAAARDFLDVDRLEKSSPQTGVKEDVLDNKKPTTNGMEPEFKDVKSAESGRKYSEAKQSEIKVTEIQHSEMGIVIPIERVQKEVPKIEIKINESKSLLPLECTLPPLEDPSTILLSPSSSRKTTSCSASEEINVENVVTEPEVQQDIQDSKKPMLDIIKLTQMQSEALKTNQSVTSSSSISSKYDDYAELSKEVKHIREDKAR